MNNTLMKADEVANELGVSISYAYKLMKKLNDELKKKNYITISGRVSKLYFQERIYGLQIEKEGVSNNASV